MNHVLMFSPQAEGTLFLKNETGKTIYAITIVVNYEDGAGHRIFTIAYEANTDDASTAMTNVRPFFHGTFTRPVHPGQIFDLFGTNLLTATEIPRKAEISLIGILTSGGGVSREDGGSFKSDPILEQPEPEYPQLARAVNNLPEDVLLNVSIDARGRVTEVVPKLKAESEDQLLAFAVNHIRKWHFFPAIRDGFGTSSQLSILLQFRAGTEPPVHECFIGQGDSYPKTFAIVTLASIPQLEGRWRFFYGGYEASGRFLGQQQMFESTPRDDSRTRQRSRKKHR